jgi:protein O-mannosyl-transferase
VSRATPRWRAIAPWALVALAALLPYLNALHCGFAFDDGGLILENPTVAHAAPWWRPLTTAFWPDRFHAGLYRPVTALTLRLQRGATHDDPAPFHAVNLLLHAAVSLLAYALLRRLFGARRGAALAAAVLLAAHPLHAEAVTYVVGRAELLAALCGLAGYLVWLGGRGAAAPAATGVLFALAAGSKESALAWGLMLVLHRAGLFADGRGYRTLGAGRRDAMARDAGALAGFAAYLVARRLALGSLFGLGAVSAIDNPLYGAPIGPRILTALEVAARGLGLLLWPARLSADYSFDAIPLRTNPIGLAGLLALAIAAGLAAAWWARRRAPLFTWAAAFWFVLLLPVSNLIVPIGTIMAERLLYLPSLGAIALLALAGGALVARAPRWAPWLAAALVLALAGRTWARNRDWVDDRALFRAAVATEPRSVKARANLGAVLAKSERADDLVEAGRQYRAALAIAPAYLPALDGLGYVLTLQRSYDAARATLHEATERYPTNPEPWVRLGNLELETGDGAAALTAFEGALAAAPALLDAWIGKASALFLLARFGESADAWLEALHRGGDRPDLRRYVGVACLRAGRLDEAERQLRAALAARPSDPSAVEPLIECLLARRDCEGARAVLSSSAGFALDAARREALTDSAAAACR